MNDCLLMYHHQTILILILTHMDRVCQELTLLGAESIQMAKSCSTLLSTPSYYLTCHLYLVTVWHFFSNEKLICESCKTISFYTHGPKLLWAEFVMGRDCYGPNLFLAELSRDLNTE